MRTKMPFDSRKPPTAGKTVVTPKAPTRSKPGAHITPRLAASPTSTISPSIGKEQRTPGNGSSTTANATERISTPVKNFLSSNITPRSGSRRARVDSASSTPRSTPNGTPSNSRPTSIVANNHGPLGNSEGFGLGLSSDLPLTANKSPGTSIAIASHAICRNAFISSESCHVSAGNTPETSKIFYASDACDSIRTGRSSQDLAFSRTGFIYADGHREPIKQPAQTNVESKFCYANGVPEPDQFSTRSPTSSSPTTVQRFATQTRPSNLMNTRNRSTSPLKEFELPSTQTTARNRRSSGISHLSLESSRAKPSTVSVSLKAVPPRSWPPTVTHSKTHSLSSIVPDKIPDGHKSVDSPILSVQSPQSLPEITTSPLPANMDAKSSVNSPVSPLVSPMRQQSLAGDSNADQLNSSASNARRERKVLDLEISNSSLLAINRTLEREMRKQKAELRRFRRLTSSGRLSVATTNRSISDASTFSISAGLESDIEEEPEEDDELSEQLSEADELEDTDSSSGSSSPRALKVRQVRQYERDERRLRLDLNRHKELLIDSQKLNQSLKRCLGWTEELILEGRKALTYQVRVSDVAMGGRVLHADEQLEVAHTEPRKALLSPTHIVAEDLEGWPWNVFNVEQEVSMPAGYASNIPQTISLWTGEEATEF